MKSRPLLLCAFALSACQISINDGNDSEAEASNVVVAAVQAPAAPSLRFEDAEGAQPFTAGPVLAAQVTLDRLGFSSGVIDGKEGQNYRAALRGFQEAHDLPQSGKLDPATAKALQEMAVTPTRLVRIPAAFAAGPFTPDLPKEASEQAKLPHLGYRDLTEALTERFHTTRETLVALNAPGSKVAAGAVIRVPNVADIDEASLPADDRGWNATLETLGVAPGQPAAARVIVDKSEGVLRAFDDGDRLIAQFPATMGSEHDPLPIGTWKIQGVSRNPDFRYNPALFWDASTKDKAVLLKPGPNGPVGVVWIDISKPHYGIHGTGEPQSIGRAESHGCIRLSNWDAARLAQMVKPGVPAIFQE